MSTPTKITYQLTDTINTFKIRSQQVADNLGDLADLTTNVDSAGEGGLVAAINEIDFDLHGAGGGNAATDLTTTATTIVDAINELDSDVGPINTLTTNTKASIVKSINELDSDVGSLTNLQTTNKSNIVNAINEIEAVFDASAGDITFAGHFDINLGTNDLILQGDFIPLTDDTYDLGIVGAEWRNLRIDGTATIDVLQVDETATVTGNLTVNGTTTSINSTTINIGNSNTDNVVFTADVNSNFIPNTDAVFSLGTATQQWGVLHADSAQLNKVVIDNITVDGNTITSATTADFLIDAAGDIILDADLADVILKDNGTQYAAFTNTAGNLIIKSNTTTALTFSSANVTAAGSITLPSSGGSSPTTTAKTVHGAINELDAEIGNLATIPTDAIYNGDTTVVAAFTSLDSALGPFLGGQSFDIYAAGSTTYLQAINTIASRARLLDSDFSSVNTTIIGSNANLAGDLNIAGTLVDAINYTHGVGIGGINYMVRHDGTNYVPTNVATLDASGNFVANGTVKSTGNFTVGANKFDVTAASGNTSVGGTLTVTGATTLNGTIALGDATADTISVNGYIGTNIIPSVNARDLGTTSLRWDVFAESITSYGTTTLGDASGDTITLNGAVTAVNGATLQSSGTTKFTTETYGARIHGAAANNNILQMYNAFNGTWVAGDRYGSIEFYSGDVSGDGAGLRGVLNLETPDTTGGIGKFTIDLETGNTDGILAEALSLTATGDLTIPGSYYGTWAGTDIALGTQTSGNYVAVGATSGNGISGSTNSETATFTVTSNATSANTASTIVFRDASGNFSAGTITAALTGNASTATRATDADRVNVNATSTAANYRMIFTEASDTTDTSGTIYKETDGTFYYNPSTNILTVPAVQGSLLGQANTALTWANTRTNTVTLTGDVTGTGNATVNGGGDWTVSIATTVAANSVALGTDTTGNYVADITAGTYILKTGTAGEGWSPTIAVDATSANTASKVVARDASGNFSAGTITAALSGNASTASSAAKLTTARTIGGVSFDGTADINLPGVNTAGNQNTTGSSASCTGNSASATLASTVTVNSLNDANGSYSLVWHDGNTVYSTAGVYCNPFTDTIYATGDIVAYASDERLKNIQGNIDNALEKVCSLNGFYYTNSDIAKELGYTSDKLQVGVSAQQIQEVLPEVVLLAPVDYKVDEETGEEISKSGENYLTVKYDRIVPLLIEAIKELKAEIEELKASK